MTKIGKVLLLMITICSIKAVAQGNQNKNRPKFIFTTDKEKKTFPDSVSVQYFRESVSINYGKEMIKAVKLNDKFELLMPKIDHLTRLVFYFYYGKKAVGSEIYFCEPKDNLNVVFKPQGDKIGLSFRGFGAEKYELRNELARNLFKFRASYLTLNQLDSTLKKMASGTATATDITSYMGNMYDVILQNENEGKAIVVKFQSKMPEDVLKFYTYEFVAGMLRNNLTNIYFLAKTASDKKLIADYYFKNIKDEFDSKFDNPLIKYSAIYVLIRGMNILSEAHMKNQMKRFSFEDRYKMFYAIKDLELRNRLITDFFVYIQLQEGIVNFDKRDSCLSDAMNRIKEPVLQAALKERAVFNKGSNVFNFSFKDINDASHTLADFKGKVFMIEFYGTGCTGCANFSKQFKTEIYPEFSNNPKFEVISVNLDLSRDRWIKCLESGLYTQKSYINLSAGQESINNEMFKYYSVNAIPFILLVDKEGKLVSRLFNGIPSDKISSMIRTELNNVTSR